MPIQARDSGGTLREVVAITMRDSGAVLRTVSEIKMRDANNVLRTIFTSFSGGGAGEGGATASPTSKHTYGNNAAAIDITVGPFTTTVTGGVAPYTYLWEQVSGDPFTINTDTAASTTVTFAAVAAANTVEGVLKCTVTDATSAESETNECTATAVNLGGGL